MSKGPKLNNVKYTFTNRDNLGIESATTSIQAELCPIINTVTPRAFYWIFMTWNYYDFFKNIDSDKWSLECFDKPFLKKNDYFFVLSNLLVEELDQYNLVGKTNAALDVEDNPSGPYSYNEKYFVTKYGGMQYYNAGCMTMNFITDRDEKRIFSFPQLTKQYGEPMALAFEKVIKNTEYYKKYRLSNKPVPKNVLEEFGQVVTLRLEGFDECKRLLREAMFTPVENERLDNKNLIDSANYMKFIYKEHSVTDPSAAEMREILFDYFSPRGEHQFKYDSSLENIITDWEIVIGRQYFVLGVELFWRFMLYILDKPVSLSEWINTSIDSSSWTIDIDSPLSDLLVDCSLSYDERETLINNVRTSKSNLNCCLESGLKLILSIYSRFSSRDDIESKYLYYGKDLSIHNLITEIDNRKENTISSFLGFIMDEWIVQKHHITAFNKMIEGRDGYFFEYIDGKYVDRGCEFAPFFQDLRPLNLLRVMKDLDMLEG